MKKPRITAIVLGVIFVLVFATVLFKNDIVPQLSVLFTHYADETIDMDSDLAQELKTVFTENENADMENIKWYMVQNTDERVQQMRLHAPRTPMLFGQASASDLDTEKISVEQIVMGNPREEIVCATTQEPAEEIPLFYRATNIAVYGGGYNRTAYLCEDQYIVKQFLDGLGTRWSGPYRLK